MEAAVRVIARTGLRGLRVGDPAAGAGVSTALLHYHVNDRAGLTGHTPAFIGDRAAGSTEEALEDARSVLLQLLPIELKDTPRVRENSTASGGLRAGAVFDAGLRDPGRLHPLAVTGDRGRPPGRPGGRPGRPAPSHRRWTPAIGSPPWWRASASAG